MGILTGRDDAIKSLAVSELAFIGTLTDYVKGMSTRSAIPTIHYTLEFERYDQIRGPPIENEEPHFHYMQSGSGGQTIDPKTRRFLPAVEPKHLQIGQLYLALLNEPQQIKQLVEITMDDIESLRQEASKK
ncbi:unnamed protein product [Rotaria magnacalcarata]|uniref:Uncharacterized protein n=1 Tax=Rotaria magnacalcarata TaxID=392030 RepID=A0A816NIV6_9BILA|nr:unnamed protein product [Rotaria magnacalcarata]CAF1536905.1 unnamed protein product [Rotaria magnacalcarata]CAF1933157.1 unnamed protein product [Rotaria magnacalcarata]CAF2034164.1 unnamed protein product [Rotaria magnacalcarata]CAF2104892.1 unnamed protein product [Rotaria magnacalcarata]